MESAKEKKESVCVFECECLTEREKKKEIVYVYHTDILVYFGEFVYTYVNIVSIYIHILIYICVYMFTCTYKNMSVYAFNFLHRYI